MHEPPFCLCSFNIKGNGSALSSLRMSEFLVLPLRVSLACQLSSLLTTAVQYDACITADTAPIRLSDSSSISGSPVNKTLRYMSSRGSITPFSCRTWPETSRCLLSFKPACVLGNKFILGCSGSSVCRAGGWLVKIQHGEMPSNKAVKEYKTEI